MATCAYLFGFWLEGPSGQENPFDRVTYLVIAAVFVALAALLLTRRLETASAVLVVVVVVCCQSAAVETRCFVPGNRHSAQHQRLVGRKQCGAATAADT